MPLPFTPAAIIFDMDGLMLDTERIAHRAWQQALSDWGYPLPFEVYLNVIGRNSASARQVFREAFGAEIPIEEIIARKQQYVDEVILRDGIALRPGLLELLDWLDTQSWPRAVGSSTAYRYVELRLRLAGIAGRFPIFAGGDEVAQGKPAPDIFLLAAERLGVEPTRCFVLEDSDAGIQAAHTAGMLPLMVPDMKPPSETSFKLAGGIFKSLFDVKDFLEKGITA